MGRNKPRKSASNNDAVLDIVVTTAGRFDCLRTCLDTLSKIDTVLFNVFVIDNASPAEDLRTNLDIFENKVLYFEVKHLAQNVGFPAAANEGARMGHAPLIMFLSDDVKLMDGAMDKIVSDFNDETIGIVGIKTLFPEDSTSPIRPAGRVQHCGLALNVRGEVIHPLVGWGRNNPKTCVTRMSNPDGSGLFAVTGACLTIRSKLFDKAGGFNSMYGKGTFEDTDLCLQVKRMGSRIMMDAEAQAYHYVGATVEKRQEGFDLQGNFMMFRTKWANSGLYQWTEWEFW